MLFGTSVYFADKTKKANKAFALFASTVSLWVLLDFSLYQNTLASYQTILNRVNLANVCLLIFSLAYFVTIFPKVIWKFNKVTTSFIVFATLLITYLTVFTNKIIDHAFMEQYGSNFTNGPLFYVFAIYGTILAFYSIVLLIVKFIRFKGTEKDQIKYVLYGMSSFLLFNMLFNLFIPMITGSFQFARFGTYSTIIFVGYLAYAILRAHLFNMKVILTEIAIVIINVILATQIFSSATIIEGLLRTIFLLIVLYGSIILLRSVKHEIKQKEELQKLAGKLDVANQHLEELGEAKDNFLSMAAHELNTPIAAIEGYLSMIIDEKMAGNINEKAMGYLKNIYGSSRRLAGLVKNLLNVSRIESNRIHLIYSQVQIEAVISQSIAEVKIKADEVGHKLVFEKSKKEMPKTWIDAERITEVIINIIGNAIKYTEPPGKIVVSTHTDGDKIVVAIEDNGRGIPKDREEHIFEKFSQVNVLTDQIKGTGLGMFITKNLIALHKGKVWFKSSTDKKDHGTTFYFSLPILKEKPFDPHEGEGALFQTGQKAPVQKGTTNETNHENETGTGKVSDTAKPEVGTKPAEIAKPEDDTKQTTDQVTIPAEVKEEKDKKETKEDK